MPPKLRKLINKLCRHDPTPMYVTYTYTERLVEIEKFKKKHPIKGFLIYTITDWEYNLADWYWQYFYEPAQKFIRKFVCRQHLTKNGTEPFNDLCVSSAVLHTAFNVLVDYVEREIPRGWATGLSYEQLKAHGYAKWQTRGPMREMLWHRPKYGIEILERFLGEDHHLARNTRIIYDLYVWWTVTRPLRPSPNEASGVRALEERLNSKYGDNWHSITLTPDEDAAWTACEQAEQDIWKAYEEEDSMMLMRLVENRDSIYF